MRDETARVFTGRRVGLEKESLRVRPNGAISGLDHPEALGAALTNASVTTDFSEALLEMVTPPCASSREALERLRAIHRFILPRLPRGEHLWNTSMPCVLPNGESIRIGEYGSSHQGRMKHAYRRGLGLRYGRRMQAIAGIHFNFSLPDEAWPLWRELHVGHADEAALLGGVRLDDPAARLRTAGSFSMMQNLVRVGWLVPYLFGASPAICRSFLAPGEASELLATPNDSTRYAPHGTSLRMGSIGYRYRDDQPIDLSVRHTRFDDYVEDIIGHVTGVHPPYAAIGVLDADGHHQQLNACRLQIENEFYGTVRPKQIPERGEMPILALARRGVRYLELRSVDVSIDEPLGLSHPQCLMLELLMLFAWLGEAEPLDARGIDDAAHNVRTVAHRGREPGLRLRGPRGPIALLDWGLAIVEALAPLAEALDALAVADTRSGASAGASGEGDEREGAAGEGSYVAALAAQRAKLHDPGLTPSARVLDGILAAGSYSGYTMRRSREHHAAILAQPPDAEHEAALEAATVASRTARARLETDSGGSFDDFLADYFAQLPSHASGTEGTGGGLGAVVLAGGLARRMGGVDKGLVPLGGRAMIEHVVHAVRPVVDALAIVANRNGDAYGALAGSFAARVVADRHPGHLGPLAGLAAGIHALGTERVMLCPCDSPFVTAALVERLDAACREPGVDIAVAHDGERLQPVFCVVRREVLTSLEAFLDSGQRKIDAWYAGEAMRAVDCRDLADAFRNINTEEERVAAESTLVELSE